MDKAEALAFVSRMFDTAAAGRSLGRRAADEAVSESVQSLWQF